MNSVLSVANARATPSFPIEPRATVARHATPNPIHGFAPDRIDRGTPRSPLADGAKATYDLLVGNDLRAVFGRDRSELERGIGAASLASNVLPVGKLLGLALKSLAHVGVSLERHAGLEITRALVRDVGGRYKSLDLASIERSGRGEPHTLSRHVGKTDDELIARLVREDRIRASSSYVDLPTAQRATDAVVGDAKNQRSIDDWIRNGSMGTLPLHGSVAGDPIGRVITRAEAGGNFHIRDTTSATVVLKSDVSSPTGYTVLTSYPTK